MCRLSPLIYALWKNKDVRFKYLDKKTCESDTFKWLKKHGIHPTTPVKTATSNANNFKKAAPKPKDQENKIVKTFLSLR